MCQWRVEGQHKMSLPLGCDTMVSDADAVGGVRDRRLGGPSASMSFLMVDPQLPLYRSQRPSHDRFVQAT